MIIKKYPSGPLEVNSYLVLDEKAKVGVIVDPGGISEELIAFVNDNLYKIPFILLTHGHSDHIGGVGQYKEIFNSKVIAYIDEKAMLNNHKLNYSNEVYGKVIEIEADEYVEEDDEVIVGALSFKFIHTPGHTKGGMCILVDDVLFSGDTLFYQSIGRTDFPGSSFKDLKAGIHDKLFKLDKNTRVLPGHMSETTIGFEMENNPFL
jgi:glyoxylase-like metal-dependent hydrolase (beta-lactamase superfamily II)